MTVKTVSPSDKDAFNKQATHPLQSYEWGEFREKTGVKVVRIGEFEGSKLLRGYQITIHTIPHTPFTIGYFPKGPMPDETMLKTLSEVGRTENALFIKLEPNIEVSSSSDSWRKKTRYNIRVPHKGLFTKYTFVLDLSKSEDELLKQMKEKTRYNIRLATRKGVTIKEEHSEKAFNEYLRLTFETTKRQGFYAHNKEYHRLMWETLHKAGIAHLFTATYEGKVLVTWVVFLFNNTLYYPYGASSSEHREVMASNLMMWEVIRWGKENGAKQFDMWGALPPDPDPKDPRLGFHRFKEGYSPRHTEFIGSFDLVLHPLLYTLYTIADRVRWMILQSKA